MHLVTQKQLIMLEKSGMVQLGSSSQSLVIEKHAMY